jgi:hypothetical protein
MVEEYYALATIRHTKIIHAKLRAFHADSLAQIAGQVHGQLSAVHLKYQLGQKEEP